MNIVLVGASGFLGRYVVHALSEAGHRCTVLSRNPGGRHFIAGRAVRLVQADVHDVEALATVFEGADAAVSMAGILNEAGHNGSGFHRVHVELVEHIIAACRRHDIGRILHVSAIGAGEGKSHYLRSKGEAEDLLRQSGLAVNVYRPSVVFGPGDSFFNRFAALLRLSPVLPLACADARMQPVYAGDVAAAMAAGLEATPGSFEVVELGGPQVHSLGELVKWTARQLELKRWIPALPGGLSRLQAMAMDFVPGKPFSTDNYRSLQTPNVAADNPWPRWGIHPASIEAVVPAYLGGGGRQRRLAAWRRRAGRD
jgi:NADH dehydrogenase